MIFGGMTVYAQETGDPLYNVSEQGDPIQGTAALFDAVFSVDPTDFEAERKRMTRQFALQDWPSIKPERYGVIGVGESIETGSILHAKKAAIAKVKDQPLVYSGETLAHHESPQVSKMPGFVSFLAGIKSKELCALLIRGDYDGILARAEQNARDKNIYDPMLNPDGGPRTWSDMEMELGWKAILEPERVGEEARNDPLDSLLAGQLALGWMLRTGAVRQNEAITEEKRALFDTDFKSK